MTEFDADEAAPVPLPLLALTVNVYIVPAARPCTVTHLSAPVVVAEKPPGDEVTAYLLIELTPFEVGAFQETVAAPLPAVATTPVGGPGRPQLGNLNEPTRVCQPLSVVVE